MMPCQSGPDVTTSCPDPPREIQTALANQSWTNCPLYSWLIAIITIAQKFGGKKLPKKIMSTDWAKTHGLAGRDLLAITLPELIYMGWQNQGLRYLGQGWFTGVLTRNIRESVFVETMLKHVRAKGIDLDSATKAQAVQRGANGGDNLTNADKAHLMDEMAQFIISPLQHNKDVEKEMSSLQRQLEEANRTIAQLQQSKNAASLLNLLRCIWMPECIADGRSNNTFLQNNTFSHKASESEHPIDQNRRCDNNAASAPWRSWDSDCGPAGTVKTSSVWPCGFIQCVRKLCVCVCNLVCESCVCISCVWVSCVCVSELCVGNLCVCERVVCE